MIRITRIYRFAASHRLHASSLTEEANTELYGKCNNPYGHGHDYVLHVSVRGPRDEQTGRTVNVGALDRFVDETVVTAFDHKHMNSDVREFQELVPTTENVLAVIRTRLLEGWAERFPGVSLDRILIQETARNTFELKNS